MAYRSQRTSASPSQSPSAQSPKASPASPNATVTPMVPVPEDTDSSSRASPSRRSIDLPRIPSASKGGCWTCRLRRKKCDEQRDRDSDSCQTCKRLKIECLGWGPRRPEWMRDKQEVERYKAGIKAQLTRAGLIRGQPRTSQLHHQPSGPMLPAHTRSHPYHRPTVPDVNTASTSHYDHSEYYRYASTSHEQHSHPREHHLTHVMPEPPFQPQIMDSLYQDSSLNALDLQTSVPVFYPQSVTPISSTSSTSIAADIGLDFLGSSQQEQYAISEFDLQAASPLPGSAGVDPATEIQETAQSPILMYYFDHVREILLTFATDDLRDATHLMIARESRGALTSAVSALANLHYTQKRVAQGLEAPDPNPEQSNAAYLFNEALFQLNVARETNGYSESDALAALHLVFYSQQSGGMTNWQRPFRILCEWLETRTSLLRDENPAITMHAMSPISQLLVKAILWLDVFSSFSLGSVPRYLGLFKRLLGEREGYWPGVGDNDGLHSLRMDLLTGCSDEGMLALSEVMQLAHWKAVEQRRGTLSFRELVSRGSQIEQRLRERQPSAGLDETDHHTLHHNPQSFPSEGARHLISRIFCEAAMLFLNVILSNAYPGVPEIEASVETIIRLIGKLARSEFDRALVFPLCLAGSLTNDSNLRNFCKGRLQYLDNYNMGHLMPTRLVMETVWQKRDVGGVAVDVRETIQERGSNLLLI
ncbi:hypothetical protein H0H92_005220 [Tricholoma furcatifolium]|nr:hypothetical protein H0H92_005220 [Tricholoma furcatifolium]